MHKTVCRLWPVWLLIAAAFLVCNMLTPVMLDDCAYATSGRTLKAIFHTQHNAYMHSNGRVLAHGIAQLFCGIWGKPLFNIVNALMMALLTMLLFCFGRGHNSQHPWAVAVITAGLVWFALPDQPITFMLMAGSLNYVWASVVVLIMLTALHWLSKQQQRPWHQTAAIALLCFVAGAWGEMYAACLAPAMMILAIVDKRYRNRRCIVAWVCFCIGALLMLLAPGNWQRMATIQGDAPTPLATRAVNTIIGASKGALPWLWIATAALTVIARRFQRPTHFWHDNRFYLIATLLSVLFTTASGASWPRTFFACYVFAIIMLLRQLQHIKVHNATNIAIIALVGIALGIDLAHEVPHLQSQRHALQHCIQPPPTNDYAVWTGGEGSRKTVGRYALSVDAKNWRNACFFSYHEKPSLPVIPRQVAKALQDSLSSAATSVGNYTLITNTSSSPVEKIVLTFTTDTVWLYPSKAARLIDIFGTHLHSHFTSHPSAWQRRVMKSQLGLTETLINSDDVDAFGQINTRGQQVVFFDRRAIIHRNSKIEKIQLITDGH